MGRTVRRFPRIVGTRSRSTIGDSISRESFTDSKCRIRHLVLGMNAIESPPFDVQHKLGGEAVRVAASTKREGAKTCDHEKRLCE